MDTTKTGNKLKKNLTVIGIATLAGLLVAGGTTIGYQAIKRSQQIVPASIKKQLTFSVLWPSDYSSMQGDKTTIKYNSSEKLLSYVGHQSSGQQITVSEQPTPESFVDIPQSYDKLIESMHQYKAFDTPNGKVYLTRPTTLKGGQTAVMNARGVLLFARPDKDITDEAWALIFNNLKLLDQP